MLIRGEEPGAGAGFERAALPVEGAVALDWVDGGEVFGEDGAGEETGLAAGAAASMAFGCTFNPITEEKLKHILRAASSATNCSSTICLQTC